MRDDLTDDVYYLIITSKVGKYTMFEDKYYLVDEDLVEAVHLEVPSMINLKRFIRIESLLILLVVCHHS